MAKEDIVRCQARTAVGDLHMEQCQQLLVEDMVRCQATAVLRLGRMEMVEDWVRCQTGKVEDVVQCQARPTVGHLLECNGPGKVEDVVKCQARTAPGTEEIVREARAAGSKRGMSGTPADGNTDGGQSILCKIKAYVGAISFMFT